MRADPGGAGTGACEVGPASRAAARQCTGRATRVAAPARCGEAAGVHTLRRSPHGRVGWRLARRVLPALLLTVVAAVAPLTPLHVVHPFQDVGRYAAGNRGVDLAGFPGQPVVSATGGVVRFAGPVAGVGVVSVDLGDGRRLTYEPLLPSVRTGQVVRAGEPIGRLGAGRAGCPAPACLHWGLASGAGATLSYADPLALLGPRRVRLLPLAGGPALPAPVTPGAGALPAPAPRAGHAGAAVTEGAVAGTAVLGAALGAAAARRRAASRRRAAP